MAFFDRVEILKGPSSIIYGDGNKSGVISRTSKKPRFDRASTLVDVDVGSYEYFRGTVDTTRPFGSKKQFSYRLIGSLMNRKGAQDFDYGRRRSLSPMLGWRLTERTTVIAQVTDYYERAFKGWGAIFVQPPYNAGRDSVLSLDIGIPRTFSPTEPYSYNQEQTRRYTVIVDHTFADWWSARLTGSRLDHLNSEYTAIPRDLINATQMQRSWRNAFNPDESTRFALDSVWKFNIGPTRHKLLLYGQAAKSKSGATQYLGRGPTGSTTNVLPLLDVFRPVYGGQPTSIFLNSSTAGESDSLSASFQEQAYLFRDRLILQAGIRYSSSENSGTNRLTGVVTRNPRVTDWSDPKSVLGAVVKVMPGMAVYVSMSEIFTANAGVQPDGRLFEPNVSDHDEVGLKLDLFGGKLSALVNAYRRRELNRIISHPDLSLASLGYRLQIPGDELTGYEFEVFLNPMAELQLNLSHTIMEVNNLGGLYTRGLPHDQSAAVVRYEVPRGRLKGVAAGLGYVHYAERVGDAQNSFYLKPYGIFDAFLSYRRGNYRYHLKVDNLTDKYYAQNAISRNIVIEGPPRMIMFRVSREF
jgi:iron complex outermembrane receptor protein